MFHQYVLKEFCGTCKIYIYEYINSFLYYFMTVIFRESSDVPGYIVQWKTVMKFMSIKTL